MVHSNLIINPTPWLCQVDESNFILVTLLKNQDQVRPCKKQRPFLWCLHKSWVHFNLHISGQFGFGGGKTYCWKFTDKNDFANKLGKFVFVQNCLEKSWIAKQSIVPDETTSFWCHMLIQVLEQKKENMLIGVVFNCNVS